MRNQGGVRKSGGNTASRDTASKDTAAAIMQRQFGLNYDMFGLNYDRFGLNYDRFGLSCVKFGLSCVRFTTVLTTVKSDCVIKCRNKEFFSFYLFRDCSLCNHRTIGGGGGGRAHGGAD